jgi:Fe-S-cluster containining protein
MRHPCLSCGACCASFRVAFHWLETDPAMGGGVPASWTTTLDPHRLAMRGTDAPQPHCAALQGAVGTATQCAIYAQRPSVCRELKPAWEAGVASAQCDRARLTHGMVPLQPADWLAVTA